jgi:hypothetical protein
MDQCSPCDEASAVLRKIVKKLRTVTSLSKFGKRMISLPKSEIPTGLRSAPIVTPGWDEKIQENQRVELS